MQLENMVLETTLAEVAQSFRGIILDVFGVLHDGIELYEPVRDALRRVRAAGIRICLLSNSPRRTEAVASRLAAMGLGREFYDGLITSGELAYAALASPIWPAARHYLHVGPPELSDLLSGLALRQTTDLNAANFVLATGDFDDRPPVLEHARQRGLPMVCANPDLDVMIGDKRVLCAGSVAASFEALGGTVIRFGKPGLGAYVGSLRMLDLQASDVIAIGDNLATDILGAKRAGIRSALVLTGVHHAEVWRDDHLDPEVLAALCGRHKAVPDYFLRRFAWVETHMLNPPVG
ncbi:TIGR01459 family HAD-type hydrolase [Rhizobium tumorigenes]|uniref:TIGR01459 family HAD-type hydrolase n=1 Tax=Rhizobium tumorigenes TaxID=2041385 RepID=A0AAF1KLC7_9HYPH|nr:TIGR01459 family HAD-type hydrolase [Rhizobium tumorigenes]WFR97821.1 TIGR01459 family HAD-type hydrolase [Rhizobium tumorigenes]